MLRWIQNLTDAIQADADALKEVAATVKSHTASGHLEDAKHELWEAQGLFARAVAIVLLPGVAFTAFTVWALNYIWLWQSL